MKKRYLVALGLLTTLFFGFTNNAYLKDVSDPAVVEFENISDDDYTCSGVFISPSVVLTAAHCLESDFDDEVEKNEKIQELKIHLSNGQSIKVQKYKIHPLYDYYHYADIALIKVNHKNPDYKKLADKSTTRLIYKDQVHNINVGKDTPETLVKKNDAYLFNVKILGSFFENTYLHSGTPLYFNEEVIGIARKFKTRELGFFDPTETLYVNINYSDIKRFITKSLKTLSI